MNEPNALSLMKDGLAPSQPAETLQRQDGDKNTQIGRAENVNINYPVLKQPAGTTIFQNTAWLWEHYNLFVVQDTFERGRFAVATSRVLNEFIEPSIEEVFAPLTEEIIDAIKRIPSIFARENAEKGGDGANPNAYFGFVTDVRVKDNLLLFYYQLISKVPHQTLIEHHAELQIDSGYPKFELNRTHWTIKHANLVQVLRAAGVSAFLL